MQRVALLTIVACALVLILAPAAVASCSGGVCSITANFNGTAIPGGDTIWFNSVVKPNPGNGIPSTGAIVYFDSSTISFTSGGTNYALSVPNGQIDFYGSGTTNPCSGGATSCTMFDSTTDTWITSEPVTAAGSGNTFLSGLAFQVPSGGLPGGIQNVTWSGDFSANPSLGLNWQFAAAVYGNSPNQFGEDCSGTTASTCSGDYNTLDVKPIDANSGSLYANSDHAGAPEAFLNQLVGGAMGGTGSNYTGSYSPTVTVMAPVPVGPVPEPATLVFFGSGALLHLLRRRVIR